MSQGSHWKVNNLSPGTSQSSVLVLALTFSLNLFCKSTQADCYTTGWWGRCAGTSQLWILLISFCVKVEELPASCRWNERIVSQRCLHVSRTPLWLNHPLILRSAEEKKERLFLPEKMENIAVWDFSWVRLSVDWRSFFLNTRYKLKPAHCVPVVVFICTKTQQFISCKVLWSYLS